MKALRRGVDFRGRSNWPEYLSFFVVNASMSLTLSALEGWQRDGFFGILAVVYGLFVLVPGLAITTRLIRFLVTKG
ncbi:hypothetical protein [Lewinella sp. JB7]|uniref:DUF805 domain-containing protein n=1 Tax=Lewinella sp. JB7 TaxID=2962887 RepID=UPI0020CA23AA|nr:hypothetical protein [Lewinella sp. JB7]MCP9235010.1 hypothetical protein [Lewinella sp. JB7]